jgi:hypothetical protein
MRPMGSVEGLVILACVALAALFGFACAFDHDGVGASACPAGGTSPPPDEVSGAAPLDDRDRRSARPPTRSGERTAPPRLLAAVPGGLCLLI